MYDDEIELFEKMYCKFAKTDDYLNLIYYLSKMDVQFYRTKLLIFKNISLLKEISYQKCEKM